jgi:hypothetical protein
MTVVSFRAQGHVMQPEPAREPVDVVLLKSQLQRITKQRDEALDALAHARAGAGDRAELASMKAARESAERRVAVLEQEVKAMQTRERSRDIEHANEIAALQRKLDESKGKRR